MPRKLTFVEKAEILPDVVALPEAALGRNEMSPAEFYEETRFSRSVTYSFAKCCNMRPNLRGLQADQAAAFLDQTYLWLCQNTTGPWFWDESKGVARLYVERECDRAALRAAASRMVIEQPPLWDDMVGVLRGVLPPPTEKTHFLVWADARRGFHVDQYEDEQGFAHKRITFTHPKIEQDFLAEWQGLFTGVDGSPSCYISNATEQGFVERSSHFARWLINHCGVGEIIPAGESRWSVTHIEVAASDSRAQAGFQQHIEGKPEVKLVPVVKCVPDADDRWEVSIRYTDIMDDLLAGPWGQVFVRGRNPKHVVTVGTKSPAYPDRPLPADFSDYLKGLSDSYCVIEASGPDGTPPRRRRRPAALAVLEAA